MNIKEARQQFDLLLSIENGDQCQVGISSYHKEDISEDCKPGEDELTIQAVHRASPRKRRRDHVTRLRSAETTKMPHIMTLYDRSINLNNLTTESTLYSASREWMLNRPSPPQIKSRYESCDSDAESQTVFCYDCTDTSPYPECEPPQAIEGTSIPIKTEVDINTLRKMNLKRWKSVRERWQETYEENFRAHPECVNFIKALKQPSTPDSGSQL